MDFYFHGTGNDFAYTHETNDNMVKKERFRLHSHPHHFEMLLFLGGYADFLVEGNVYPLQPYDLVIAQNYEMHYVKHKDFQFYERIVLDISNSFFANNDCSAYRRIFTGRPLGMYNKIPADVVIHEGIDCIISRIERYLRDEKDGGIAARGALLELLYAVCCVGGVKNNEQSHSMQMNEILHYVNAHLSSRITLDDLAERFFLSKGHLCRVFKQNTGYTVNQYITYKRMMKARELFDTGLNWQEASTSAGFGDYSNFYKIYRKMYGKSPREQRES